MVGKILIFFKYEFQVKNMCRQEVSRLEEKIKRSHSVIEQYKKICTDLGSTFEADKQAFEEEKKAVAVSYF